MTGKQPQGQAPAPLQKKDIWDIIDIFLKGVLAVVVSGALTYYSINADDRAAAIQKAENRRAAASQKAENERAEQNRKAQTLIQMVNARESAESDLRAKMFQTLMQHYFSRDDIESQIVVLELIGLNFRDSMQIKPMFEQLDRQLRREDDSKTERLRELLRDAASAIIKDQLRQIKRAKDGYVCRSPTLDEGEPWTPPDDCNFSRKLTLSKVAKDYVEITPPGADAEPFTVTYYDMPMVDFTHEPNIKYAVVLIDTDPKEKKATLGLSVLPTAIFNSQVNSYQFDALLFHYLPQKD
ncbi:MAG: hypothetical protein QNL62_25565 [Gammaproteobacteria bacterium]|nr:hypothetical protein [Gammaproteobacteria bacterium]